MRKYEKVHSMLRKYEKVCKMLRNYKKVCKTLRNYLKVQKTPKKYILSFWSIFLGGGGGGVCKSLSLSSAEPLSKINQSSVIKL